MLSSCSRLAAGLLALLPVGLVVMLAFFNLTPIQRADFRVSSLNWRPRKPETWTGRKLQVAPTCDFARYANARPRQFAGLQTAADSNDITRSLAVRIFIGNPFDGCSSNSSSACKLGSPAEFALASFMAGSESAIRRNLQPILKITSANIINIIIIIIGATEQVS